MSQEQRKKSRLRAIGPEDVRVTRDQIEGMLYKTRALIELMEENRFTDKVTIDGGNKAKDAIEAMTSWIYAVRTAIENACVPMIGSPVTQDPDEDPPPIVKARRVRK